MQLHTLNLDCSTSLTSFKEDCFKFMPNLMCLSMCETRIANLWTTIAALTKLPSLVELRFQNWLCCDDAGLSSGSSGGDEYTDFSQLKGGSYFGASAIDFGDFSNLSSIAQEAHRSLYPFHDAALDHDFQISIEDSSDDSDMDFSNQQHEYDFMELLSNIGSRNEGDLDTRNEVNYMPFITCYLNIILLYPGL